MDRTTYIRSLDVFKKSYPESDTAILATAISDRGEVVQEYFEGNYDSGMLCRFITTYMYVNDWNVTLTKIKV